MKLTLDCFLFMIGTGQYFADIRKSKLGFYLINNTKFIKYRRAKCGSLCKSIPAENDDIFITKQIIEEYKIRPGTNFPIDLSATHFGNHLERISDTLKFDFKLKNKMARKTFTTIIYYDKKLPISILQILLGHQNVNDTLHYLRLDDDNSANQAKNYMFPEK